MKINIKNTEMEITNEQLEDLIRQKKEEEESKSGRRRKPEMGEDYYIISNHGQKGWNIWSNDTFDNWNWKTYNVFKTRKERDNKIDKINALAEINDYIDNVNKRLSKEEIIDEGIQKFSIYYTTYHKKFEHTHHFSLIRNELIGNLKSAEIAEDIIEIFNSQLRILWDLE